MTRVYQEAAIAIGLRLTVLDCANCGIVFGISTELEKWLRENGATFYCPNGHGQHFGSNELDKLRRKQKELEDEADRLYRRAESEKAQKNLAKRQLAASRGQITKLRKRAQAGLCPVCNRHFEALERHMHSKHTDCTLEGES